MSERFNIAPWRGTKHFWKRAAIRAAGLALPGAMAAAALLAARAPAAEIVLTVAGDPITGIYNTVAGGDSTEASAGNGAGTFPDAESPPNAIDNDVTTKYLNFGNGGTSTTAGVNTGFYVTPGSFTVPTIVHGVQFATANDSPNRDPMTITIEGSRADPGTLATGTNWAPIYSGPTGLAPLSNGTTNRNTFGALQTIANGRAYTSYRVLVTSQRGSDNSVQYSEAQLVGTPVQALTSAADPIVAIYNATAGGNSTRSTAGTGAGQFPAAEAAPNALDGDPTTKYLNFGNGDSSVQSATKGVGTGFYVTPASGGSVLSAFQFTTANDAPNRDPLAITIEGSNASGAALDLGSSWTQIYTGSTGLDTDPGRVTPGVLEFVDGNSAAYSSYRVLVTSQRGSDNSVQYSEMTLFGAPAPVPEPGSAALLALGGGALVMARRRRRTAAV